MPAGALTRCTCMVSMHARLQRRRTGADERQPDQRDGGRDSERGDEAQQEAHDAEVANATRMNAAPMMPP
jgi:hypothetical protein